MLRLRLLFFEFLEKGFVGISKSTVFEFILRAVSFSDGKPIPMVLVFPGADGVSHKDDLARVNSLFPFILSYCCHVDGVDAFAVFF